MTTSASSAWSRIEARHSLLVVGQRSDQDHVVAELLEPRREPGGVGVDDVTGNDFVPEWSQWPPSDERPRAEYGGASGAPCLRVPADAGPCAGVADEAEAFLLDRGLLTRTSRLGATETLLRGLPRGGRSAPDSPGFGQWPRTKFPWFGELGARRLSCRGRAPGKNLLVAPFGRAAARSHLPRRARAAWGRRVAAPPCGGGAVGLE